MSTKYSKLAKNTVIFTIGNFATKILSFLIVPFYTYLLTTEDYGRIDLFFTSGSLIVSFLTLQIHQAMMRFLLGKETNDNIALSNSFVVFIVEALVSLFIFPVYIIVFGSIKFALFFYLNILFSSFNIIFSDYLLVVQRNLLYALKGVVITIVLLSFNIITLVVLKLGIGGYIFANVFSQFVGCAFLIFSKNYHNKISFRYVNKTVFKKMLLYSIPLIPNSLMWWIMSSGDKYIINFYLGDSSNGIYALALKFPTVISMMYSFFIQAWAISAIEEYNSEQKKQFYEKIYRVTNALLFITVSVISLFVKLLYTTVMNSDYKPAWIYVPILAIATAFSSQTSFFAVFYTLSKKTKSIFITTLIGTVVNIFANFTLVQIFGLQGIALGTAIGYFVVLIIRMVGSRKDMKIDLDLKRTLACLIVLLLQVFITIICSDIYIYCVGLVSLFVIVYLYRLETKVLVIQVINKFHLNKK